MVATAPRLSTAPVLAVLVCHDGDAGLAEVLSALRGLTVRPRHVLAVNTGSADGTAEVLAGADDVLDGVLDLPPDTGFGAGVSAAVEHAGERWGDPGRWLWLLHDDSAPEPDCLRNLLHVADLDSAAAVLGPLGLDRGDPRLVIDAGLSADASGHRQTGIGASELDPALAGRADLPIGAAAGAVADFDGPGRESGSDQSTSDGSATGGPSAAAAGETAASADSSPGVEPEAGADSKSGAERDAEPDVGSAAEPGTASGAGAGTGASPASGAARAAEPGGEGAESGAASDAASDVESGASAAAGADAASGSGAESGAVAEIEPASGADAGTAPGSELDGETGTGSTSSGVGMPISEVLAVSTAGVLIRRDVHAEIGGFDPALPIGFEDVDFGWRVNSAGHLVLCVPSARVRHSAALRRGQRSADAAPSGSFRTAERVGGVRTFLVNSSFWSFVLGVPRLAALAVLRAAGFGLLRRWPDAAAELAVVTALLTGRMELRAARAERRAVTPQPSSVRGLLTSRTTRLRNGLRAAFAGLVRERVRREIVLGRVPAGSGITSTPAPRRVGPDALPAGALARQGTRQRRVAGLRRPAGPVVVELEAEPASPQTRPSPVPRGGEPEAGEPELLLVEVNRWAVLRELALAPAVVLTGALVLIALITHGLVAEFPRFDGTLQGGRLLPAADLSATWRDYVASWHPVNGGTGAPAPAALLVVALLGTLLGPIGGPAAVLGALLLFGVPLAGLTAYASTRLLPMSATRRSLAAGAYALLPLATSSAAQGRVDVVVAHVLVPPVLAGLAAVLGLSRLTAMTRGTRHWLSTAGSTALGLAVLGAFAPLVHALLVVLALVGFVAVPSEARRSPRRVAGLAAVVLLPVACLLPWPVVLLQHPEVFVHGLGARFTETPATGWAAALSADGAPATWAGGLLVLAAAAALVLAPRKAMVPGLVIAVSGWATAVVVQLAELAPIGGGPASTGSAAPALIVTATGLLWVVLAAGRIKRLPGRAVTGLLAAALLITGVSAVLAGRGPLRTEPGGGTPALAAELAAPGGLLVLQPGPQPPRLVEDRRPHFGDDDLAPAPGAAAWLRQTGTELRSGDPQRVRSALAAAAARGAGHVALPPAEAVQVQRLVGELVADHGKLGDGSVVLRVLLPTSQVELLGPDLARQARLEPAPSPQARPIPVPADSPEVAVRMSDGGLGRTLVLAAEQEPGWQATIDGREAPLATAWGHQVAVPLPERTAEVRVDYSDSARNALLVVQAAALLFTGIAALPSRRRTTR